MDIWKEIVSIVVSNGIFATLFVFLFFYQLKDSSKRENKYLKTIETLTDSLKTLDDVKQDITEIKNQLNREDEHEELF